MMGTFVVLAGLLVIVFLSVRSMVRQNKQGRSGCCGDCSQCRGRH